jgi:hypothetical protein
MQLSYFFLMTLRMNKFTRIVIPTYIFAMKLLQSSVYYASWGIHSIVKLNNTFDKKKTFYIKDHQNRSFFSFFFMSIYTQYLLHSKKIVTKFDDFVYI